LIKSPKIYLWDSGILHALLDMEQYDSLLSNPIAGASWESFIIENIIAGPDEVSTAIHDGAVGINARNNQL